MNPLAARIILVALTLAGIGWTVWSRVAWQSEHWTTSRCLQRLMEACPQVGILLVLLTVMVIQDAMPEVDRWLVLVAFIAAYCLGHAIWFIGY